jgi:hypothetical protein
MILRPFAFVDRGLSNRINPIQTETDHSLSDGLEIDHSWVLLWVNIN